MRHEAPEVDGVGKCVAPCAWITLSFLGVVCGRERGETVSKARGGVSSPIPAAERALQELVSARRASIACDGPISPIRRSQLDGRFTVADRSEQWILGVRQ
jgi:hypothetical protein